MVRRLSDFISASANFSVAVWDSGKTRTMTERMRNTYCILDAPGQPDPTGQNDSTTALRAMVAEGVRMEITKGDFVTTQPLLITKPGTILFGHGGGVGCGNHPSPLRDYVGHSRIIAAGDAATRRVMTRRRMRASAADPNDPAMCAVIDVEADGVQINDLTIWLDCDYTNMSPNNEGANWDIGVFVGTRPMFQARNLQVLGYFRRASIYLDVSSQGDWPALLDYDGNPLDPKNPSNFSGGDGTILWNPYTYGGRIGLAVLGGLNDADAPMYYDERTGATRSDNRGASGFSDFNVFGGHLGGPDHHSGYRRADPLSTPLTPTNLLSEPDDAPAALYIDGRCNNASSTTHGLGCIRGMNFFNTRISTSEFFRARLRRCDEVSFIGRAWSDVPVNPVKSTQGNTVSPQDYNNYTYGHFTTHPTLTGFVHFDRKSGGNFQPWLQTYSYSSTDAIGRQRVSGALIQGDALRFGADNARALVDVRDTGEASEYGGEVIASYRPFTTWFDMSTNALSFGWRIEGNTAELRYGGYTAGQFLPTTALRIDVSNQTAPKTETTLPFKLPAYTVAQLTGMNTGYNQGTVVYCTDGNAGGECLAVYRAGAWRRVLIGAIVSTTT